MKGKYGLYLIWETGVTFNSSLSFIKKNKKRMILNRLNPKIDISFYGKHLIIGQWYMSVTSLMPFKKI